MLLLVFSIYQLYQHVKDMKIWQQVLAQQMKPLISPILMILAVLSFLCLLQSGGLKQSHAQLYESCRQAKKPSEGFLD